LSEQVNLHDAVTAALKQMGLDESVKQANRLDRFYEIGELPDEVREKQVHVHKFDGVQHVSPVGNRISIVPLHDIHLGAINSNKAKFEAYVDYIVNTPDTYTIGLGDLIENATKCSIGMGVYESEFDIDQQVDQIADYLRPIAKAGKLLGLMPGNHEYRTMKLVKLDPMYLVAKELGVPYLGWSGYFKFEVGNQVYKAFTFHGASGAGSPGGRINSIRKLRDVAHDMDMYFMGHVHSKQHDTDAVYYIDEVTNTVKSKERHYIIGGSLLSYFGSYAEMSGMAPAPQGLLRVDLYTDNHRIKVHR
jgi:hypothetical protein